MKEVHLSSVARKMPGNKCPTCGRTAEGGTGVDLKGPAARIPTEGDYAVCLYCGALNRYGANLVLRAIDRTERRKLLRDPRLKETMEVVQMIATAKRREWQ